MALVVCVLRVSHALVFPQRMGKDNQMMFAVNNMTDIKSAHVTVPATALQYGMTIQVTETDSYRDEDTGRLIWEDQTWQGTVSSIDDHVWSSPSEVMVYFIDGPPVWLLKGMYVPLVMGPVNSHGIF